MIPAVIEISALLFIPIIFNQEIEFKKIFYLLLQQLRLRSLRRPLGR